MVHRYTYTPRFGFDIRVKPPKTDEPPIWEPSARSCDAPDCLRRADCRAPKNPDQINEFYWFCTEHARDYNRSWNFFDGMSEAESEAFRESAVYGHRPTWAMNVSTGPQTTAHISARGQAAFEDAFGMFGGEENGAKQKTGAYRNGRKLTRLQEKAFATLDLGFEAKEVDIKARYKTQVKRFHPDANGGDRSTETHLQEVLNAYKILEKSGFC